MALAEQMVPIEHIKPIERIGRIDRIFGEKQEVNPAGSIFKGIFEDAINNVIRTDRATVNDAEILATGDMDDLHTLSINNMKASLSVQMLVQMRNKALDAYNSIVQITV